ncbi:class I SAM-dependent methyltransferase [Roseomonas sp. CCTCC AB2023176]|uniref:class I SAM-dependent methyltransferase n=1 Tax=Roseomonas sp. CCTCC AB2023176 TaxID=3342640 RepID=UPI0035D542E0
MSEAIVASDEDGESNELSSTHALPPCPDDVPAEHVALWHVLMRVFGRTPHPNEVALWGRKLDRGLKATAFLEQLVASRRFVETKFVRTKNPPGHFFSPVVDPDEVRDYVGRERLAGPDDLAGIAFPLHEMEAFWTGNRDFIAATPFTQERSPENRYFYGGGPYNYGDAITLRMMIGHFRPRRVIEIGSGFSSACMLDAADHAGLEHFHLTCIEPYPKRLRSVLRDTDWQGRVTLHERGVQGMPLDDFAALEAGDILFIDSTHVMKTGSDVHYELFHILPVLKAGVVVHIHDCRFPLEYSDIQIFQKNYSWNEAYAVRALLMYSTRFKVIFSGSLFARERESMIREVIPTYLRNPGSALWLQVR